MTDVRSITIQDTWAGSLLSVYFQVNLRSGATLTMVATAMIGLSPVSEALRKTWNVNDFRVADIMVKHIKSYSNFASFVNDTEQMLTVRIDFSNAEKLSLSTHPGLLVSKVSTQLSRIA